MYLSESAHWSTKVIRQSGIQSLNTRRERLAASREKQQGYGAYSIGTGCHKQAYYQVFQTNMIIFSIDYSCFMISVQIVLLTRRAGLSLGKNVLQHALRAQAVERSRTISLPDTSITKLPREFERAHLNEHAVRTSPT